MTANLIGVAEEPTALQAEITGANTSRDSDALIMRRGMPDSFHKPIRRVGPFLRELPTRFVGQGCVVSMWPFDNCVRNMYPAPLAVV